MVLSLSPFPDLREANLQVLSHRDFKLVNELKSLPSCVYLFDRLDGYLYTRCSHQGRNYWISREEDISADLRGFRLEVLRALQEGMDLLFLLGVGLGYRARVAWEMMEWSRKGQLVILEQSLSLWDSACRCSDLRDLFESPRCDWLVGDNLSDDISERLRERQWFGARKSLFFWGYQTSNVTAQPSYHSLIHQINRLSQQDRQVFLTRWTEWIKNKKQNFSTPQRILVFYQIDKNKPLSDDLFLHLRYSHSAETQQVEIPISDDSFTPPTLFLNEIMRHDADEVYFLGCTPEAWLPADIIAILPIPLHMR